VLPRQKGRNRLFGLLDRQHTVKVAALAVQLNQLGRGAAGLDGRGRALDAVG